MIFYLLSQLIPLNAYYFLYVQFLWNSWFFYVFVAPRVSPDIDDGVYEVLKSMQAADDLVVEDMQSGITENEVLIGWEGDVNEVLAVSDELTIAQVDVFNSIEGHAFRNVVASKLETGESSVRVTCPGQCHAHSPPLVISLSLHRYGIQSLYRG